MEVCIGPFLRPLGGAEGGVVWLEEKGFLLEGIGWYGRKEMI